MCSHCVSIGDPAIVKLLIDSKADVNAENVNGETPICMAARNGMCDEMICVEICRVQIIFSIFCCMTR